jgi:uncharacterized membrane protein HdeD (DUF308 family)
MQSPMMDVNERIEIDKQLKVWSVIWGVLLVLGGLLALATPWVAGIAFDIVIAWIILVSGGFHLAHVLHENRTEGKFWRIAAAVLYICIGLILLFHPMGLLSGLTLLIGIFFLLEGAVELAHYFATRTARNAVWNLVKACITLVLGLLILAGWPSSALWVIGTFIGISLLLSGANRITQSLAPRSIAL